MRRVILWLERRCERAGLYGIADWCGQRRRRMRARGYPFDDAD